MDGQDGEQSRDERERLDERPHAVLKGVSRSGILCAHSDDADHRFRQADRRFQAMPITLEERRSIGALGSGLRVEVRGWSRSLSSSTAFSSIRP